jgi:Ca2+-transporting ATPase
LETGDFVPADARLVSSASLRVDESALTGESVPVEKNAEAAVPEDTPLGDRQNMVFSGTAVTYGRGKAVVTGTGMSTEMGKIADLLEDQFDERTPLQNKLATLGKYLGLAALGACAIIFGVGLFSGMHLVEMFIISVSLAVASIPEGLPAIVTVVLAIGVQRMVSRHAIIRKLPAVETLGSASVICSDKTGTLTQNRMTLVEAFAAERDVLEEITEDNSPAVRKLLRCAALCCDVTVSVEDAQREYTGDPTETAIVRAADRNGMPKDELDEQYPRLAEIPFDSERKLMTTVNCIDGRNIAIVKGAFDVLAEKCAQGPVEAGREYAEKMGGQALRVLAVAYRELDTVPAEPTPDELETDLTFMGLVGMIDPPRPEAGRAVEVCRQAGIRPVMITGDHVLTASTIARELGIAQEGDRAVSGGELSRMSQEELEASVADISVYARVSPADKLDIVRAWQRKDNVVAMTGDGVNDAPSLKAADIGCAMGIAGTDVAKGAADMVLTDDNFATIVEAVREGRRIFDNIRKVVGFLLGTNIGEVLTVLSAMLLWQQTPLLSTQILWINLVTDSFPAIALGMEPVEDEVMKRKPRAKEEGIFAGGLGVRVVFQGILFAVLTLVGFALGWGVAGNIDAGRTMAFIVLAQSQVVHSFNMRSAHSLFRIGFFTNRALNGATLLSTALVAAVVFVPPVAAVFGLVLLSPTLYAAAVLLALVPLPALEIAKRLGWVRAS